MNFTVFTGTDPSANLAELFTWITLSRGPVCAVVPDTFSVTAMQKQLAEMSGNAFIGHKVYTLEGLTTSILSRQGKSCEKIKDHLKYAIVAEIVRSRIREQSKYYAVSSYPGFIHLIVSFLEDVRSRTDGMISDEPDLVSIASAYESHLKRLGLNDHEGLVKSALESDGVEQFAESFNGPLIIDGFYDLTDAQYQLLARLVRRFGRSAATLVNDSLRGVLFGLPARLLSRFRSIGAKIINVMSPPSSVPESVLSGFMGGRYPESGDSEKVQIHTFRSETAEADWVAGTIRNMLDSGTLRSKEIMVVSRDRCNHGSALERALRRHGIPVQGGITRPFITHPVVRLALDALEASMYPEKEEMILSVQKSCFTGNPGIDRQTPLEGMDDRAWSCMIAEVDSPEGYVTSFKKMLEWLKVRENLNGGGIKHFAPSETAAFEHLTGLLEEFASIYSSFRKMMKADEFNHLLRHFLAHISLPDRPHPVNGVLVLDVNHARYVRRDVVFITGLDDSSFPAGERNYVLYNDSSALEFQKHNQMEEPLLFYMAAYGAKHLFLSYPGIDDEGCDNSLSPYLREIRDGIQLWCKPTFHARVAGAAWEGGATNKRGQYEQLIRVLKKDFTQAPVILSMIGMLNPIVEKRLINAIKALLNRYETKMIDISSHSSFNEIWGEWNKNCIFSVTDLEMYMSCPVRFFLSRVLGLSVEKKVPEVLDNRIRGQIVHEILAQFYTERLKHNKNTMICRSELHMCQVRMKEIVETVITRTVRDLEGMHPVIFLAEKKFFQSWMEAFLNKEIDYFEKSHFKPHAFEVGFGHTEKGNEEKYPALSIKYENETVLIRGRIDRIDVTTKDENCYVRIIDYKTGVCDTNIKELIEGTALQIPLYLEAAKKIIVPGSLMYDGVYYNLRDMELKEYRISGSSLTESAWEKIIERAYDSAICAASEIRKGHFPRPEKRCDEFCEFISLCRGGITQKREVTNAAE